MSNCVANLVEKYVAVSPYDIEICQKFVNESSPELRAKYSETCILKQKIKRSQYYFVEEDPNLSPFYINAEKSDSIDTLKTILSKIEQYRSTYKLSLSDKDYIVKKQNDGEIFIALINNFNFRYNLPHDHWKEDRVKKKFKRYGLTYDHYNEKQKKKKLKYHKQKEAYLKKQEQLKLDKKMKILTKDMKKYILWVKRQRLK